MCIFVENIIALENNKYTKKAIGIFKSEGLNMSMEELAQRMGVTKKTLYNRFGSKEGLIEQCMKTVIGEFTECSDTLTAPGRSAADNFVAGINKLKVYFADLSPVFLRDLQQQYGDVALSGHRTGMQIVEERLEANIKMGIEEGAYRRSIDPELIARYLSYSLFAFFVNHIMRRHTYTADYYFDNIIELYVNGLVQH